MKTRDKITYGIGWATWIGGTLGAFIALFTGAKEGTATAALVMAAMGWLLVLSTDVRRMKSAEAQTWAALGDSIREGVRRGIARDDEEPL